MLASDPTVAFRCDLGPQHGVGHLMRCLAIAEELRSRGVRPFFLADADSVPFGRSQLRDREIDWARPAPSDAGLLDQLAGLGPRAVVVDSYHLPSSTYAAVRAAYVTLSMVDGDPAGREGDLVVDQNVGAEDDVWSLSPGTRRLAGLRFALMRDGVRGVRGRQRVPAKADMTTSVLAFFGGTDAFRAAPSVTEALVATGRPFELHVVGATSALRAELAGVAVGPGQLVHVLEPTSRLMELAASVEVVVSAAGTSTWELLCAGAACGLVCVADNQRVSYARAVDLGVVAGLGHLADLRADPTAAVDALVSLLEDAQRRRRLRSAGVALVDGRGRERVVDALLERVAARGPVLSPGRWPA